MINEINIVDGNLRINLFINKNNIYILSNDNACNLDKYLKYLKTANILEFYNHGTNYILNKGDFKNNNNKKVFHIGKITITASLIALLAVNSSFNSNISKRYIISNYFNITDFNTNDLYDFINSSDYLKKEEKDFLYNEEFLKDILEIVNCDNYLKYSYMSRFNNIKIESFKDPESYDGLLGYYSSDKPSSLYIRNYDKLDFSKKDIVSHEFIHLCQDISGYNLITEASAEIISKEYYNMPISCYDTQVRLLKNLMEIIGPDSIWEYNFTGNFSLIEDKVKPYLSEEEYSEFLEDLTFEYGEVEKNAPKFDSLKEILEKLYFRINNDNMDNNKVISLINEGNITLKRYYFNKRYIDKENSYYLDYKNSEYKTISLDEAIKNNIVNICASIKTPLNTPKDKKMALIMAELGSSHIERKIDYNSANIIISRTLFKDGKMYISGIIDEKKYEECDVDELAINNIINVDYYLVDSKYLSAYEYLNHIYDKEAIIDVSKSDGTIFNGETVYCYMPKKVYLKPISEQFEKTKQYVLTH